VALLHEEVTGNVIGAAMEVHRALGCGFLEPVYQEAMEIELNIRGVSFVPQAELEIRLQGPGLEAEVQA
jgi:GxxExxY protein